MSPSFRLLLDPPTESALEEAGRDAARALQGSTASDDKEFLAAFRRAVRLEPNDPDYYYMLGDALARLGRHREALPALREAILLSPAQAEYRHGLGAALWHLGRYEEAAEALGEAVRLRPGDLSSLVALGAALAALGRFREAVRVLHEATRLEGRHASAYSNLGAALWGLSRQADALRAFRRASLLEPHRPELHRNTAQALAAAGHAQDARAALRKAIELRRDDPGAHLDLGELLYARGQRAEARAALEEAVRLDPDCLRSRPASREALAALRLELLRSELAPRAGSGLWAGWNVLGAFVDWLRRDVRPLVPRTATLGAAFGIAALVAGSRAAWCLAPPYFKYFLLKDRLAEVAGAPVSEDSDVKERLEHAVREEGLEDVVRGDRCQIETRPKWRMIRCEYEHPIELIPGVRGSLRFRIRVERPFLAPDKTIFF